MSALRPMNTFNRGPRQDKEGLPNGTMVTVKIELLNSLPRERLRGQARWIRDVLDPQVARDGPDALQSDDLLTMDELLRTLLESDIGRDDILYSRIHLAVNMVAGFATRWPRKLVDKCDMLKKVWAGRFGSMQDILLYEPGGRLHDICKPEDINKEKLVVKWLKTPGARLSPMVARKAGHLGFEPGDWWINPLFAHRDGITDSGGSEGSIVCDAEAAYAVVMTGSDEIFAPDGETIQYRARSNDPGRYRLSAASVESRHPIRILRSHTLNSLWKPRAGLRYEGLYNITGWSVISNTKTKEVEFVVNFRRLPTQAAFETVMARPWTEEVEDYQEYKRIRDLEHSKSKDKEDKKPRAAESVPAVDGVYDASQSQRHGDHPTTETSSPASQHNAKRDQLVVPAAEQLQRQDSAQQEAALLQQSEESTCTERLTRRTSSSISVQTVPDRQTVPSNVEIAAQLTRAAWDQR